MPERVPLPKENEYLFSLASNLNAEDTNAAAIAISRHLIAGIHTIIRVGKDNQLLGLLTQCFWYLHAQAQSTVVETEAEKLHESNAEEFEVELVRETALNLGVELQDKTGLYPVPFPRYVTVPEQFWNDFVFACSENSHDFAKHYWESRVRGTITFLAQAKYKSFPLAGWSQSVFKGLLSLDSFDQ
jgi:hypothetical protein